MISLLILKVHTRKQLLMCFFCKSNWLSIEATSSSIILYFLILFILFYPISISSTIFVFSLLNLMSLYSVLSYIFLFSLISCNVIILSHFILFHFILSSLIISYFVLCYLILSYFLILYYVILFYLILSYFLILYYVMLCRHTCHYSEIMRRVSCLLALRHLPTSCMVRMSVKLREDEIE